MPGAGERTRTLTVLPPADFESAASPIPPPRLEEARIITQSIPGSKQMPLRLEDFDYPYRTSSSRRRRPANAPPADCSKSAARASPIAFSRICRACCARATCWSSTTPVVHARLFGTKQTGGQVEILIERPIGDHEALAQIRASKSPGPAAGSRLPMGPSRSRYWVGPESSSTSPSLPEKTDRTARSARQAALAALYRTPRRAMTRRATRRSMHAITAPSQPPPRACISTKSCLRRLPSPA